MSDIFLHIYIFQHFSEGGPTPDNPNPVAAEPLSGKRSNQRRHALKKRTIPVVVKKELFEKERPDNIENNVMVSFPWALEESVTACSRKIKGFLLSL